MSVSPLQNIANAQVDFRDAYAGGAPGMLVSAAVWAIAAFVAWQYSPKLSVWCLFIGGALIHPIGILLGKLLGRRGQHHAGNPLAALAMESTVWLIASMPLAYAVSLYNLQWFFPAMMAVIGGRYAVFSTLYGSRWYWACAAALLLAAYATHRFNAPVPLAALTGAVIETVFAVIIYRQIGRTTISTPTR